MANNKLPIYELTLEKDNDAVYAISLVDYPAIEQDFLYFSDDTIQLSKIDNDQQIISGPVMVPDMLIYRADKSRGEYYIKFSADTIAQFAEKFLKEKNTDSFTLFHEYPVDSIYLIESYLTDDNKKFGDLPNGTWCISARVTDKEIWDTIKNTNLLNGFSVEVMSTCHKVELSKNTSEDCLKSLIKFLMK